MAGGAVISFFISVSMLSSLSDGSFDPFMDQTMFMIDWKGPLLDSLPEEKGDNVVVMTKDQEQYQCILPQVMDKKTQEQIDSYKGPSAAELMETLYQQTSCSYRLESYWTYELCHGKHLRQYHEVKEQGEKPKLQEYFLGFGRGDSKATDTDTQSQSAEESTKDEQPSKDKNIKHRRVDGVDLPYYQVTMKDGTPCDLTQQPRLTRVLYVCQPDGHGEVYELKETSTCEYEVMVLTAVLCSHPLFRPKNPPVNKIRCHAMSGAPMKPQILDQWDLESTHMSALHQHEALMGAANGDDTLQFEPEAPKTRHVPKVYRSKSIPPVDSNPPTAINKLTDKQVLRDLLVGDYCLQGGVGWWKHEVCIGRHARQFHKDKTGETNIFLGRYEEAQHLQWLAANPNKKPKPVGQRKVLNFLYTGGDVCDVTGKARSVEVRLKCIPGSGSSHGLSLYLTEPVTCQYILVVESALLCDLMDQADDNGLLSNVNL